MGGTTSTSARVLGCGLAVVSAVYERQPDGVLVFRGERPGPDWHAHGFFARWLWTVVDELRVRARLLKARWRHISGKTCHSRPPDDVAQVHSCTLVVVVVLWSWLESGKGVHVYEPALPTLADRPSIRTVQRWLRRALGLATTTHQLLRTAVIERGEPRPMKRLFPSGLAPPAEDARRRWRDRALVETLRSGLVIVVDGAVDLAVPLPLLLAEARGRSTPGEPFLL